MAGPATPGARLQSYTGGVPADVAKMLQRQVAALKRQRGGLLPKLLAGAAAAAAVAGAVWWRWGGGGGGGGARDPAAELASLGQRIASTESRIQ